VHEVAEASIAGPNLLGQKVAFLFAERAKARLSEIEFRTLLKFLETSPLVDDIEYAEIKSVGRGGGGTWAVSLSSATCHVTARGLSCRFFLIEHHRYHFHQTSHRSDKISTQLAFFFAAELALTGESANRLARPSGPSDAELGLILLC